MPIDRSCSRYPSLIFFTVAASFLIGVGVMSSSRAEDQATSQMTFANPDDAAAALFKAAQESGTEELKKVLGPGSEQLISSGDQIHDVAMREKFLKAYAKSHRVRKDSQIQSVLLIGEEEYPFPIPLVAEGVTWRFDSEAGADEILNRRIGENEHAAMRVMLAYVAAQMEYASQDRDGKGLQYARRFLSTPGNKDGLFWPAEEGEATSPMGPLVAEARAEGYRRGTEQNDASVPYHGYVFKMLEGQSSAAESGARDFVMNDRMIGGFGLAAAPAEYGNSGIMSFIVNQDGTVYEQDLGPDSRVLVAEMKEYDPGEGWHVADLD